MIPWAQIGLWAAAFVNILLIGLQGRNLNTGNYLKGALIAFALNNTQFIYIHAAVGYSHSRLHLDRRIGLGDGYLCVDLVVPSYHPSRTQVSVRRSGRRIRR